MFPQTLEKNTESVLAQVAKSGLAKDFYMAGGTALALQLGHRKSIDLDWFSAKPFENGQLKSGLAGLGNFVLVSEDQNTVHGVLDNVRVSFLGYRYSLLYPFVEFAGIHLADKRDIAAMKLDAISTRGSRKDFVDLYFLLNEYSLPELMGFFEKKFFGINYNKLHILKSLVFFEDAEAEPMPVMLNSVSWEEIKNRLAMESNKILG